MNLRIAELRKKNNLTQQELGDMISVSYQTISKWENGVVLPDITMLPKLSQCFHVSVDALLGLVLLDEEYKPSNSGTKEWWKNRVEYLKRTRRNLWNEDYVAFLIHHVWQIDRPVEILDCGCGYGALGLMLLPLLPEGSKYVGVDLTEEMIREGEKLYAEEPYDVTFIHEDVFNLKCTKQYDMVISQAVLRHVNHGEKFLQKMVAMTKPCGLVVSMECNRKFEANGFYIHGLDYAYLCERDGLKKLWQTELEMQNRDYSIAMKVPHYMKAAGLKNVDCRMNDRVHYLTPEHEEYNQKLEGTIRADHWDDEKDDKEREANIAYFMNHGMNRKEAEEYCNQQNGIVRYLKENRGNVAFTKFHGIMISYGWR